MRAVGHRERETAEITGLQFKRQYRLRRHPW